MIRTTLTTLTAIAFAAALPGAATAIGFGLSFAVGLDLDVNPLPGNRFEVIEARGAGAQDIWCAAALYAEETLGQGKGRLYVAVPRGPAQTVPGRKGVAFTLTAPAETSRAYSVSVNVAGQSLPIFHARQFCRNNIIEPGDIP